MIKGVCEGCGGKLEPIRTIDNSHQPTYWVGCKKCSCFRQGIEKKYWQVARVLVMRDGEYKYNSKFEYSKSRGNLRYWLDTETAALSGLVKRITYLLENPEKLPPKRKWLKDNLNN